MTGLEFVCTYLDYQLIISNVIFEDHLCQLQIVLQGLRRAGLKVNMVRFISDFRFVYKCLVRKHYTIPKISDILQRIEGITYTTSLDLSIGYHTLRLDPDAKTICTIIT